MSADNLRTFTDAYQAAVRAGDYATARTELLVIQSEFLITPNLQKEQSGITFRWIEDQLKMLDGIEQRQKTGGTVAVTQIAWKNPACSSGYDNY